MLIEAIGPDQIDRLEPFWLALHAHHQAVSPGHGPFVDDASSWAVRRGLYTSTLAAGGFALICRAGDADVGYALAGPEPTPWPATFRTEPRVYDLHSIFVSERVRGLGLGSRLLDAVDERLDQLGARDRVIGAVSGNVRAIDLYRRRGYLPTGVILTRFGALPPRSSAAAERVEPVSEGEVDALRDLWLSLHRRHRRLGSSLGPFLSDADSWEVGRRQLAQAAAQRRMLRLGPAQEPLGLVCFRVSRDDSFWADTWRTGREVAELEALAVDDRASHTDVATTLLDALDDHLACEQILDLAVSALESDRELIQIYEERGFLPTWVSLTRFGPAP